jgi:hypothetical protein
LQALLLPEPLSAGLLREREGAQQQLGSQAPGQLPQHEQHQPHPQREQSQQQSQHGQYQQQQPQLGQYQQQHQQQEQYQQHHEPSRWAAHGRWNGGSAAGGGREQQRQWEEMDARLKREVEEEAALEEEVRKLTVPIVQLGLYHGRPANADCMQRWHAMYRQTGRFCYHDHVARCVCRVA